VLKYLPAEKLANNLRGFELFDLFTKDPLLVQKYTLTTLRAQMKDAPAYPIEEITVPTMFINGQDDELFTIDYMKSIFNRLNCDDKEFIILENQAHLIFQEEPELISEKVTRFLEKFLIVQSEKDEINSMG
jgi:esterase/lipase